MVRIPMHEIARTRDRSPQCSRIVVYDGQSGFGVGTIVKQVFDMRASFGLTGEPIERKNQVAGVASRSRLALGLQRGGAA